MATTAKEPGILRVRSKITRPNDFPVDVFHKWYEQVHIPDLFKVAATRSAARYVAMHPETTDMPYLALYPLQDVQALFSPAYAEIPLHHEWIPGPSHYVFDYAAFDIRYFWHLRDFEGNSSGKKGAANYVLTLAFDPPMSHDSDQFESFIHDKYLNVLRQRSSFRRLSLYWARNSEQKLMAVAEDQTESETHQYFAVAQFDEDKESDSAVSGLAGEGFECKLIGTFGEAATEF